jgi:hypothetical protein
MVFSSVESYKLSAVAGFVYSKFVWETALPLFSSGESCTLVTVADFVYLKFVLQCDQEPSPLCYGMSFSVPCLLFNLFFLW